MNEKQKKKKKKETRNWIWNEQPSYEAGQQHKLENAFTNILFIKTLEIKTYETPV